MKRWTVAVHVLILTGSVIFGQVPERPVVQREINVRLSPVVHFVPDVPTKIVIPKGTSGVLVTKGFIKRFVVGDPQVVASNVLTEKELVLNGKNLGQTNLIVWEERDGRTAFATYWVEVIVPAIADEKEKEKVVPSLPDEIKKRLEEALAGFGVSISVLPLPDGTVAAILKGDVETPEEVKAVETIASFVTPKVVSTVRALKPAPTPVSPEEEKAVRMRRSIEEAIGIPSVRVTVADDKIILSGAVKSLSDRDAAERRAGSFGTVVNRIVVEEPKVRQFLAEVKVLEVSRTALKRLGIDVGRVQLIGTGAAGGAAGIFSVVPGEAIVGESTVPAPMGRVTPLGAQINALLQTGAARLLASPQERALEGTQASFLVGGLVPIPVFGIFGGAAGAAGAASVVFFPFGITLTLLPEATPQGEIFLQMRVEVTAPDFSLATNVLGTSVPGFRFRGLDDIKLILNDGDTVVLSGLIQDELREQVNRFPVLSRIPLLGELFKSRQFVRNETELVLMVTVHKEEVTVSQEALEVMRTYQKKPPLSRPTFGIPGGGLGLGQMGGLGGTAGGFGAGMPTGPSVPPTGGATGP